MPSAVVAPKRKRQENGDKSQKRRKSAGGDDENQKAQIETLEAQVHESRKHYNNIATLIELAGKDEAPATAMAATEALCRVFISLLASGNLIRRKDASDKEATVVTWLRERLADYKKVLLSLFHGKGQALKALLLAMALLKAEAQHMDEKEGSTFPRAFFDDIIAALLTTENELVRAEFSEKFIDEYHDIRYYTFQAIKYATGCLVNQGLEADNEYVGISWHNRTTRSTRMCRKLSSRRYSASKMSQTQAKIWRSFILTLRRRRRRRSTRSTPCRNTRSRRKRHGWH